MGLIGTCVLVTFGMATPQSGPSPAQAAVVTGALRTGRLGLDAFGLGDGGVQRDPAAGTVQAGEVRTPGGVRVRARAAGVKLDFATGGEVLVSPSGRVHLRGGEQTLPCFGGVQFLLADGSAVRAWPQSGLHGSLRCVEVDMDGRTHVLWQHAQAVAEASYTRRFTGLTLCALGDGRMLYQPTPIGPIVVAERILCPHDARAAYPPVKAVLVGEVLRDALLVLPEHAPQRSVQFPQLAGVAAELAFMAPKLFAAGARERPAGALGALVIPLHEDWRLQVAVHPAMLTIGLAHGAADAPAVEWTVGTRTEVRFVRPGGGLDGGPRYMLAGIEVGCGLREMLPVRPTQVELARARRLLVQLGGSPVQALAPDDSGR